LLQKKKWEFAGDISTVGRVHTGKILLEGEKFIYVGFLLFV